ncbi:Cytochrome c oxidase subunit 4 [Mucor velutinosus]|uniref:Cytochrome c oxidase subunit 4 n=1 Tax=Mucor velutinosus TaxID=708070 RepID=A0AAN7DSZ8_9FUNG|nr:Cytochrome c oxidase subunit 4 [Mucor velutinosus]
MTTSPHKQHAAKQKDLRALVQEKIQLNNALKRKFIRAKKEIRMLMFERDLLLDGIARLHQDTVNDESYSGDEALVAVTTSTAQISRRVTWPYSATTKSEETATVPSVPPKRSRINRSKAKTRRVQPVQRDQHGNPILPLQIGVLTVTHLGRIVTDHEAFHNERYIFPVGYTVQRVYPSMIDPNKNTLITATIIDGGGEAGPKFQLVAADQPNEPIVANSSTGAWTVVVRRANEIRQRDHSNSASGPDYFGLKHPTIAKMIQDLPGARELKDYIWQDFEEMEPSAARGVMAAVEKKRDYLEQLGHPQQSPGRTMILREDLAMQPKKRQQAYTVQQSSMQHDQPPYSIQHGAVSALPYRLVHYIPHSSPQISQHPVYYHHQYINTMPPVMVIESDKELGEWDTNDSG